MEIKLHHLSVLSETTINYYQYSRMHLFWKFGSNEVYFHEWLKYREHISFLTDFNIFKLCQLFFLPLRHLPIYRNDVNETFEFHSRSDSKVYNLTMIRIDDDVGW